MSWGIGYDEKNHRDIGYGVPAICDYPNCKEKIDRGLAYVCGGDAFGGELGCGLFFCGKHMSVADMPSGKFSPQLCEPCLANMLDGGNRPPFAAKPDLDDWTRWKLKDASWRPWRKAHPALVKQLKGQLNRRKFTKNYQG